MKTHLTIDNNYYIILASTTVVWANMLVAVQTSREEARVEINSLLTTSYPVPRIRTSNCKGNIRCSNKSWRNAPVAT